MKLFTPLLVFGTLVSSVIITYPDSAGTFHLPHLTATFGPQASQYSVSGTLTPDYTMLCTAPDPESPAQTYFNQIVLIERGVCTFTDKALNAQAMGAVGVIIGGNDNSDILGYMGGADGYQNVNIPTVYVSGQSYQKLLLVLTNYASTGRTIAATLNSVGEAEGTIGFLTPLPTTPPSDGLTGDTSTTGPAVDPTPTDPNFPPPDTTDDYDYSTESESTLTIVWIIVGISILVKCCILVVACRRRYRSRSSSSSPAASASASSSSSSALLTEGEVSDATPVVYATYPAPSSAFTVSAAAAAAEEEGALPAQPAAAAARAPARPFTASSLAIYPSIQYAPLMPQATAPSDVYAYDLEKQSIIIRG